MIWWLKKQLLRLKLYAFENFQNEAESLIIWYAVVYALGAAFYLTLPWEMPIWVIVTAFEIVLVLLYLWRQKYGAFKLLTYVLVFIIGVSFAKADALYHQRKIETKIPEISYLFGKVKDIDKNYRGRTRLLLSDVNNFEADLKGKFKVTINQQLDWLEEGKCVELVAEFPNDLSANPLKQYDTARTNFYQEISAAGFASSPVFEKDCEEPQGKIEAYVTRARNAVKRAADAYATASVAAIIRALSIGDKSAISETQALDYRRAGLAHLLAISGMHLGLIALFMLFLIRVLLLPFGEGRFDWRKPAAVGAFMAVLGYFLISGQSVSCRRAFIMTTLILFAILINRRAISLRLWALALIIVVTIAPSAVVSAGFLMSFAAVLGITAFYERYSEAINEWWSKRHWYGRLGAYFLGVILTDLAASLMTLPYTIYYFHQFSLYTSLANLLAAPVVAFWVMPTLLVFLISIPLGMAAWGIKPLVAGVQVINEIAGWVSGLEGANVGENLSQMPEWSIVLITFGLLWLCIWGAKWRRLGLILIVIGFIGFIRVEKAEFLFDKGGKTFACLGNSGKYLQTPWHKNRFLNKVWNVVEDKDDESLKCDKEKCVCHGDIEFGLRYVRYKGKRVDLQESGYINHKRGVVYVRQEKRRIWH